MVTPHHGVIKLELPALLSYRDVALRFVSAACAMVAAEVKRCNALEFEEQVVSALGEAFNNTVLHAYAGRSDGLVTIEVENTRNALIVRVIDNGASFDIGGVRVTEPEELRESGMGFFIIRAFIDEVDYRSGPPNVLQLNKLL